MAFRSNPAFAVLFLLVCAHQACAEKLQITSTPAGASVELDGVTVGTTPFEKGFPGGYFHKTYTALSTRLEHPMVARISLPGYVTKELKLTEGPMNWISLNGRNRGEYWIIKSKQFHVNLEAISETFTGGIIAKAAIAHSEVQPDLPLDEVVRIAKPAVVYLRGSEKSGSGFFVTSTGIIATNAHLARGEEFLSALLSTGQELRAKVVFIDSNLDIGLAKVQDPSGNLSFAHLGLRDSADVRQGESVVAIGNPGDAMRFSATQGIVSAVGEFPSAGPGTWIQTDTAINPGNSGGPLLNLRGEVVGINTQKLTVKNVSGIGFALSASDLLTVLRKFYPHPKGGEGVAQTSQPAEPLSAPAETAGFGTVILTKPDGAEILIDSNYVGNIPARLRLTAAKHTIVVRDHVHADWNREIVVQKDSEVTVQPEFP